MTELYSLVHEDAGPVATFTTIEQAAAELRAVLEDEPSWLAQVWIEPFMLIVGAEHK